MTSFCFADLFELTVDAVPDRTVLVAVTADQGMPSRRYDYAELDDRVNRLAHGLAAAGIAAGDHVGIYAYNCAEWIEAMYALYKLRAVPVNVNYRYVDDELRYLFDNADVVGVIYQRRFGSRLEMIRGDLPLLRLLVEIDDGTDIDDAALDAVPLEELVAAGTPGRDFPARSGDDVYLLYTGGTTGMPKGVMWRQEDVFFALGGGIDPFSKERVSSPAQLAEQARASAEAGGAPIVMFTVPPLMHGAGQFGCFNAFHNGYTAVIIDRFEADRVWEVVQDERVNTMSITGDAMARPLADALERRRVELDTASLITLNSTAAIFSPAVKEQLLGLLPNAMLLDAIGSTESGMNGLKVVTADALPKEGITTVDAAADAVVLDDEMKPIEPGSGRVGRLARAGNVPIGYYKDPERSAATFPLVDGVRYAVPGDFATIESDGSITLIGRGSQSINSGGEKVFPEEVEGALKRHPDVFDALVVGLPDERWGERVAALVQPRPGRAPTLGDLDAECRKHLAGYKVPRQVFLVEAVPRLASGKPDYRAAKTTATELAGT